MQTPKLKEIDLNPDEISRYARHLSLEEIGIDGQKKLKASSVICIGSGGLASPILLYLGAAGVGRIGIVDSDFVEDSNLQRQVIHGTSWINKPKIQSARSKILDINPYCEVITFETRLTQDNALEIIKPFDIVCDCTDNFPSRYLINDACLILNKPNIYGSIDKFEGQATVFNLDNNSPNYRDLVPEPPIPELVPSCAEAGVMGVVPGIIGLIQATEAIKIITGIGKTLSGRLLVINTLNMKFKELKLLPNMDPKSIDSLIDYKAFCSGENNQEKIDSLLSTEDISIKELKQLLDNARSKVCLIDVRSKNEYKYSAIKGSTLIPLSQIQNGEAIEAIRKLSSSKALLIHCKSGSRSKKATLILKSHGIRSRNVAGGIEAWANEGLPYDTKTEQI